MSLHIPAQGPSWNRYLYVGSDPINYGDPKGLRRVQVLEYTDCYGPADDQSCEVLTGGTIEIGDPLGSQTPGRPAPRGTSARLAPGERDVTDCLNAVSLNDHQKDLLSRSDLDWSKLDEWQKVSFLNMTGAMSAAGVDYSSLQISTVEPDRMLFAPTAGVDMLQQQLANSSNFWIDTQISGREHPGMASFGVREARVRTALQFGIGPDGAFVDIDLWNPAAGLVGVVGHAMEVAHNKATGLKTNPFDVAQRLGKEVVGHTCW